MTESPPMDAGATTMITFNDEMRDLHPYPSLALVDAFHPIHASFIDIEDDFLP